MRKTYIKQVRIGNYYKILQFSEPVYYDFERGENKNENQISNLEKKENVVKSSGNRAKASIRDLIEGNLHLFADSWNWRFITFTFDPKKAETKGINVQNLEDTNNEWKKFRQRLEYRFKQKIYYLTVHERQKNGNVHYHTIFLNIPKIRAKDLEVLWSNGFIKNKRLESVEHVVNYCLKYITKSVDDDRVKGKKSYFHNLPYTADIERDVDIIIKNIPPKENRIEERTRKSVYTNRFGHEVHLNVKTFIHLDPQNPPNLFKEKNPIPSLQKNS